MLEVIESLSIFLDDKEIKERVQVSMLMEEESIEFAIQDKYTHLLGENPSGEWKGDGAQS